MPVMQVRVSKNLELNVLVLMKIIVVLLCKYVNIEFNSFFSLPGRISPLLSLQAALPVRSWPIQMVSFTVTLSRMLLDDFD